MKITVEDARRIINSLTLLGQESAENGGMTPDVYADLFETIRLLTDLIKEVSTV